MAEAPSSSSAELLKQLRNHEVAIAELGGLPSTRVVYEKNGNIFFRTTVQKATVSEQRQLDLAKDKLKMLNSPS
ncbi:Prefoldin beta-like [Dillenia turbinata]|uniref:Prefoldin beta-like n=1 Tax=Dillenia turbinata TaxID=194707 RepID=A0AAN8Z1E0_9MAGN